MFKNNLVKGPGCPWRGPRFDFQCSPLTSTSAGHAGMAYEDMQAKHPYNKYIMHFKNYVSLKKSRYEVDCKAEILEFF